MLAERISILIVAIILILISAYGMYKMNELKHEVDKVENRTINKLDGMYKYYNELSEIRDKQVYLISTNFIGAVTDKKLLANMQEERDGEIGFEEAKKLVIQGDTSTINAFYNVVKEYEHEQEILEKYKEK